VDISTKLCNSRARQFLRAKVDKVDSYVVSCLFSKRNAIPSWASLVESLTSAEDKGIVSDLIGIAI
jgi:hypothetical protein